MTLDVLLLRFEAPLMSFGDTLVDQINPTRAYPGRSMLTGLLGNALGYRHQDAEALTALQARLRWAAREDRAGRPFLDYHTVNLASPHMLQGWTTRGVPEGRDGGASSVTTIRYRHYLADAAYVVAVTLAEGDGPDLDAIDRAVTSPARPLFIGRKCCLPSTPLRYGRVRVARLRDALMHPDAKPLAMLARDDAPTRRAWWPVEEGVEVGRTLAFTDDMDWANQLHVGRRYVQEGIVTLPRPTAAAAGVAS
jgi:CRISPR system Cascade subunit CasD